MTVLPDHEWAHQPKFLFVWFFCEMLNGHFEGESSQPPQILNPGMLRFVSPPPPTFLLRHWLLMTLF